jgi:membrane-bound lytic murein transglycosylase B
MPVRRLAITLSVAAAAMAVGCAEAFIHGGQPAEPPAPDASLPRQPAALAERLSETDRELGAAVDRWRTEGSLESYPPPDDVTLWALHQQRIHLFLTPRERRAEQVVTVLGVRSAAHLKATFRARRGLGKITPATPGRYRTGAPEPPARLLAYYRGAQRRFGVGWPVLAAINFVESAFGRLRNSSAAGA